jgi:ABC-2 type transport system ATP-binding protein
MPENAIETFDLTRYFDSRVAVEDLTLAIPTGSVFGFLGPNGAGKTTTVRMLSALIDPTRGSAQVSGYELGRDNMEIRKRVGVLTEFPGLYIRLSAWENLLFFAGLSGWSRRRAAPYAEKYMRMMDLWERRSDPVSAYSKGMRQRLAICRALLHQPEVVFMDEPTSGLDPEAAHLVRNAIRELRDQGRTVFLSTHNMPEAEALCDVIGIFSTRLLRVDTLANLRGGRHGIGTVVRLHGDASEWLPTVRCLEFVREVTASNEVFDPAPSLNGHASAFWPAETGELAVLMEEPARYTPLLVQTLAAAGAPILYVGPLANTLESVYLELLGRRAQAEGIEEADVDSSRAIPAIG